MLNTISNSGGSIIPGANYLSLPGWKNSFFSIKKLFYRSNLRDDTYRSLKDVA